MMDYKYKGLRRYIAMVRDSLHLRGLHKQLNKKPFAYKANALVMVLLKISNNLAQVCDA